MLMAISLTVSAQTLQTRTYTTSGHPTEAVATPDGQYVLVTVDVGRGQSPASGIDIFRDTGKKLEHVAFQPLGAAAAQGIVLLPHTRALAVGLSNAGVAFLSLDETLQGKATVKVLPQGERSGSGYLAATPDGQVLFVANEYGEGGNLGVIALHRDETGNIHPEPLAHIRTPNSTPGVAMSPDGSRVYAVGEVVRPDTAQRLAGHGVPELERQGCVQGSAGRAMSNGVLYAIDVAKAMALSSSSTPQEAFSSMVAVEDAGCSPVREALSPDGATLYVTARGDNRILVFGTKELETDRDHAFLRAIPTGGEAPVGIKLFHGGKSLLVANSNRFSGGPGNVAFVDLSDAAKPILRQTIKTGEFPRNITVSPDGERLYLTVFSSNELMVLGEK
jgi:DNA-binding beta-propeller fold protein YncE